VLYSISVRLTYLLLTLALAISRIALWEVNSLLIVLHTKALFVSVWHGLLLLQPEIADSSFYNP